MSNHPNSRVQDCGLSPARTRWAIVAILLLLACSLWHIHILNRWMERRSDLLPPWVGARVALTGGNPYAISTTQEIQRRYYGDVLPSGGKEKDKQAFAYPIYTVFFIAPLAWLPWPIARVVFVLVAIPVLAAFSLSWLRVFRSTLSRRQEILLLGLVFTSWPMLIALRHQQLTLLAVVFLSGGSISLARNRPALAGALFSCAAIKPQAAALLLLWVMLRAVVLREWRLPTAFAAGITVELLAGTWLRPSWFHEWLVAIADYHHYTGGSPSLCIFFGHVGGGVLLGGVVLLSLAALWRNFEHLQQAREIALAASLLLAITCALLPTGMAWVYNQTLCLPGCLFVIAVQPHSEAARLSRSAAIFCLKLNYFLLFCAIIGETVSKPNMGWDFLPYFNLFLPSFIAVALAMSALTDAPVRASRPQAVMVG